MKSDEWNGRLFTELVEQVGTPGDPLFLFVDADLLARCTDGQLDPESALDDFCRAFNTTDSGQRFQRAALAAKRWERSSFEGIPPFVDALAMTVLAVTLPSLGGAGNVYARQRQLLGKTNIWDGVPPGYSEYVPILWTIWNRWLSGAGSRYGEPTASAPKHWANQGYARSQSFMRSRDKDDLYDFFDESDLVSETPIAPETILERLRHWLAAHPTRNARLLSLVTDKDYEGEFLAFLPRSLSFWSGEKELSKEHRELDGLLLWSEENDRLDIVADIRAERGLLGAEVQLIQGDTYTVASDDTYLYLFDEETLAESWFGEPIADWPLTDTVTISWFPQETYVFVHRSFHGWIQVQPASVMPGSRYRILTQRTNLHAVENLGGKSCESLIPGWDWVADTRLDNASSETIDEILNRDLTRRVPGAVLTNGLPLGSGNRYLEGGEPDIRIGSDESFRRIEVDGRDRLGELMPVITDERYSIVRLSELHLDPGQHRVTVDTTSKRSSHALTMMAPERKIGHSYRDRDSQVPHMDARAPDSRVSTKRDDEPLGSESLIFRKGSSAFVVTESGEAFSVRPHPVAPNWLTSAGLIDDGQIECFLETAEIYVPDPQSPGTSLAFHLVYRRSTRGRWYVRHVAQRALPEPYTATETALLEQIPPELVEFLATDIQNVTSDADKSELRAMRQSLLNARARSRQPNTRPVAISRGTAKTHRWDLGVGPSVQPNPYNEFLEWMSEQEAGYSSILKAQQVFSWLWLRSYPDIQEPNFTYDVVRSLQDLGHVQIDKLSRRLWVAPTVLATIPNSRSLRVLTGSRAIEFQARLRSGDDEDSDERVTQLLQNMTFYELHSSHPGSAPTAPDTVYVQVGSALESGAETVAPRLESLGVRAEWDSSARILRGIPTLRDQLDERLHAELPLKSRLKIWQPPQNAAGHGRWRDLAQLPGNGSHFVRVDTGFSRRYMWWDSAKGSLSNLGWAYGKWAYETSQGRKPLILHKATTRQLLLEVDMPLPLEVSKALVARTGLLPRSARCPGYGNFKVFENVSSPLAERVAAILGHTQISTLGSDFVINCDD